MNVSLIRQPGAFLPILLSLAAMSLLLGYVAMFGITHSADAVPHDEGAPARVFQRLIVIQIPIVIHFAVKWLPRAPRHALGILALQAGAAITPILLVAWLEM